MNHKIKKFILRHKFTLIVYLWLLSLLPLLEIFKTNASSPLNRFADFFLDPAFYIIPYYSIWFKEYILPLDEYSPDLNEYIFMASFITLYATIIALPVFIIESIRRPNNMGTQTDNPPVKSK